MSTSQEITFWFSERKHNRGAYDRKNVPALTSFVIILEFLLLKLKLTILIRNYEYSI